MKNAKVFGILALFMILSSMLFGCSKESASNNGKDQVVLKVWGDTDNQAVLEGPFKKINEDFMKKHPNIKLDYQYAGNFDSINVAIQSDSLPDLFWVQGNKSTKMAEMAKNGFLLPLDKFKMDISRFPEESINYATVDGKLYSSMPSFLDYAVIYYNKEIFAKYKLDKPKNWSDFENIVKTLADNGETPLALGGKGDFDRYWFIQVLGSTLFDNVLTQIKEGKQDIDTKEMVDAFNAYQDFAKKGYYGKNFEAVDGAGAQLAFTNGKAAMTIDGTWNNNVYKDMSMEVGRFALPNKEGIRYAQSGPSNFNTYAVSAKTKHPKEAAEYVKYLNSLESQQVFEDMNGNIPVLDDIKPKDETVGELAAFDKVGNNIYHVLSSVANEKSKPQDLLLSDVLPKLMTSKITGEEAAQMIMDEIKKSK
ncbi:extracellular solute-binding protein [Bacillus sp. sid0103]|uniref:ABC transporter substrate-binding protein n=1 Tax=Bacillus sp. sid0103 TaxID=2856337 RepID=UPI001C46C38E|nr:extracellular solute-binding protein [Bacillus sp. sid0103]MBV7504360.1 extracellular solute-binding protein [Bacillus sp. sid0103]